MNTFKEDRYDACSPGQVRVAGLEGTFLILKLTSDLLSGSGAFRRPVKGAPVRGSGGIGSENADMSSDKECEKHSRRKSKGSCARLIRAG